MADLETPEIDETSGGELALDTAPAPSPSTVASPGFDKYLSALGLTKPDTTRSDALLVRDLQLGQERRAGLETMAARRRAEAADMGRTADTMAAERAAAKPAPLTLPEAPKPQPRAFAEPAPDASLLSQLHAVVLGAGQIAQQMAALKGANILGMTAIKGAMEGWQAGDNERANREIQAWQRNVEKLLAEHNDRTAAYKRLLEDHSLTWSQRFSLSRLQAEADQFQDMAVASEQQDIGKLLQATMRSEQAGATLQQNFGKVLLQLKQREAELEEKRREADLRNKQFELQLAQTAFDRAESRDLKEREGQRMEALRRDIVNLQTANARAIAEGHDAVRRETNEIRREQITSKKEEKERGLQTMGKVLDDMEGMLDGMNKAGLLPKSEGRMASVQAASNRWLAPNQDLWRQWQALQGAMVGYERQIYDDKGARALSVYKSLLDFVDHPPTAETAKAIIGRMRSYIAPSGGQAPAPVPATPASGWRILP